jgi:hypothetical protein
MQYSFLVDKIINSAWLLVFSMTIFYLVMYKDDHQAWCDWKEDEEEAEEREYTYTRRVDLEGPMRILKIW